MPQAATIAAIIGNYRVSKKIRPIIGCTLYAVIGTVNCAIAHLISIPHEVRLVSRNNQNTTANIEHCQARIARDFMMGLCGCLMYTYV